MLTPCSHTHNMPASTRRRGEGGGGGGSQQPPQQRPDLHLHQPRSGARESRRSRLHSMLGSVAGCWLVWGLVSAPRPHTCCCLRPHRQPLRPSSSAASCPVCDVSHATHASGSGPQERVHDAFVELLTKRVAAMKLGSGLEPGTTQGPLISAAAVDRVRPLGGAAASAAAAKQPVSLRLTLARQLLPHVLLLLPMRLACWCWSGAGLQGTPLQRNSDALPTFTSFSRTAPKPPAPHPRAPNTLCPQTLCPQNPLPLSPCPTVAAGGGQGA